MTADDKQRFAALWLAYQSAMSSKTITPGIIEVVFAALKQFRFDQIKGALERHIQISRFPPTPGDVMNLLVGSAEDRARQAWLLVNDQVRQWGYGRTVNLNDPRAHYAIKAMGGWPAICAIPLDEMPFREKDFLRHYSDAERMGVTLDSPGVPLKLPGQHEINNRMIADAPQEQVVTPDTVLRVAAREGELPKALPAPEVTPEQKAINVDRIKALTAQFCHDKQLSEDLADTAERAESNREVS